MKQTSKILLFLFFGCSLVNLIAVGIGFESLNFVTKPLLVTLLAFWFLASTRIKTNPSSQFFLTGLLFSVVGDTLLMFVKAKGELFFLLGLGSFLLAHLSYIAAFTKFPNFRLGAIWQKKWLVLPFAIVLSSLLLVLWESLGTFLIPVVVYSTIIVAMSTYCFNMGNRVSKASFQKLFAGAVLFVLSDLIIAIKKFRYPEMNETLSGLAIMVTYLIGQFLLTVGMVGANRFEVKES